MAFSAPKPLPPYLFKPEVVARFQKLIKRAFTSDDRDGARAYLDASVDSPTGA